MTASGFTQSAGHVSRLGRRMATKNDAPTQALRCLAASLRPQRLCGSIVRRSANNPSSIQTPTTNARLSAMESVSICVICGLPCPFGAMVRCSCPASSIQHPASSIQHPASSIQHRYSQIAMELIPNCSASYKIQELDTEVSRPSLPSGRRDAGPTMDLSPL